MTSGKKIEIAKAELLRTLEGFGSKIHVNVVTYHTTVDVWNKKLVPMSGSNKSRVKGYIEKQKARGTEPPKARPGRRTSGGGNEDGRTNLYGAIARAFRVSGIGTYDRHYETAVDTIFLLSDGSPTAGELTSTEDILREIRRLNALRRVVVHTINFGKEPAAAALLQSIARETGGTYVDLVGVSTMGRSRRR